MLSMIQRFLEMIVPIRKAYVDLVSLQVVDSDEIKVLKNLANALEPIKLVVDALNRKNSNLISCEAAINFMIKKLEEENTPISNQLLINVNLYVCKRKLQLPTETLKFLRDPENNICSATMIRFLMKLAKRLQPNLRSFNSSTSFCSAEPQDIITEDLTNVVHANSTQPTQPLSLKDELNTILNNAACLTNSPHICNTGCNICSSGLFLL